MCVYIYICSWIAVHYRRNQRSVEEEEEERPRQDLVVWKKQTRLYVGWFFFLLMCEFVLLKIIWTGQCLFVS